MKRFLRRQWPLIGLGGIIIVVVFYFLNTGIEGHKEDFLEKIIPEEGLKLEDIRYSQDDPARGMKWVMDAKEVRFSGDKKNVFFEDFLLRLEPRDRSEIRLEGSHGVYSRESGKISLRGDLKVISGDGYSVTTEHVVINEKTRCMESDKEVSINGAFFSVQGRGFFADLKKESIKVLSDVTTIVEKGRFNQ